MGEPAKQRATYEELYSLPESCIGEIIDGELVATPRPSPEHSHALSVLGGELGSFYLSGRGGGWVLLDQTEVRFEGRGEPLVPDLAGWRRERFRRNPGHNWIDVIPDWVCEVLSPSTAKRDRFSKMAIYRESAEVGHVWLVDPLHKTLEVFGRDPSGAWVTLNLFADKETVRADPFPEVAFVLSGLWLD